MILRGGGKMPEADTVRLKTARGSTIVAAFVPYKSDFPAKAQPAKTSYSVTSTPFPEDAVRRPTILISHGTAVDLGRVLPWYRSVSPTLWSTPSGCRSVAIHASGLLATELLQVCSS